jgi:hypothetical protein
MIRMDSKSCSQSLRCACILFILIIPRTFAPLALPVGELSPMKRLHKISKRLEELKRSTIPGLGAVCFLILGMLPVQLIWRLHNYLGQLHTALLTSFPSPSNEITVFGDCKVKSLYISSSLVHQSKSTQV